MSEMEKCAICGTRIWRQLPLLWVHVEAQRVPYDHEATPPPVTSEQALEAAMGLIDEHFHNDPKRHPTQFRIPAEQSDTDLVLVAYIQQSAAKIEKLVLQESAGVAAEIRSSSEALSNLQAAEAKIERLLLEFSRYATHTQFCNTKLRLHSDNLCDCGYEHVKKELLGE